MTWVLTFLLCLSSSLAFTQTQSSLASAQRKLKHIEQNARLAHPDPAPTELTETEVNAYLTSGEVKLPEGVKSVRFHGKPGVVEAFTKVDFDQITASQRSANPFLRLFTGTHNVHVTARAKGASGVGEVHVESVEMDGVTVPRMALQFFLQRYVTPKYPDVALDTTFNLPYKINSAVVGNQNLTIVQK